LTISGKITGITPLIETKTRSLLTIIQQEQPTSHRISEVKVSLSPGDSGNRD